MGSNQKPRPTDEHYLRLLPFVFLSIFFVNQIALFATLVALHLNSGFYEANHYSLVAQFGALGDPLILMAVEASFLILILIGIWVLMMHEPPKFRAVVFWVAVGLLAVLTVDMLHDVVAVLTYLV